MREPLSDELFEVVLKQAVYDADKADLDELPSDEKLNQAYPLPEKAHKEFDRLQKAQTRGVSVRAMLVRRVAIIAITALAVAFGGLMLHPDIRAGVSHIVVQQFERFNLFHHDENGEATQFLTVDDVTIGYLPDGFELAEKIEVDTMRHYIYRKPEAENIYIAIDISLSAVTDSGLDNEHSYEVLYFNHREAHISYNEEDQSGAVIIPGEKVSIGISGVIEKNELLKIAQNIR